ncbi:DUF4111 domain-containing protein [Candidatus Fermentibacteria bacterium]|nr:DUF4111 domain-containing protein [Candidatus Fermentibacteria bacterium]
MVYPPATWPELDRALQNELGYVEEHLEDYPGYSILQLCRIIYSYETKDVVVSKVEAADWACAELGDWKRHVELARKWYSRQTGPDEVGFMTAGLGDLLRFAKARIEALRSDSVELGRDGR